MFWVGFVFYYVIGLYVCGFAKDSNGNSPPLWHLPIIALVWPALFVVAYDE